MIEALLILIFLVLLLGRKGFIWLLIIVVIGVPLLVSNPEVLDSIAAHPYLALGIALALFTPNPFKAKTTNVKEKNVEDFWPRAGAAFSDGVEQAEKEQRTREAAGRVSRAIVRTALGGVMQPATPKPKRIEPPERIEPRFFE